MVSLHLDHGGVTELAGQADLATRAFDRCTSHGLEEGLHAGLIAIFGGLAAYVLHRDHQPGLEIAHHFRGLIAVINLPATAHTNNQHVGAAQHHPISGAQPSGGAAQVGKLQASLLPAPEGGLTKPASAHPVVGARNPVNLQASDFVGARVEKDLAVGHVGAFVE